jgi:hypothetical protein
MSLILSGTDGLSDVDGSAATPALRGTDANTGIFFPAADTIAFAEGGAEVMRIDSSGNVGIGETSPAGSAGYTQLVIKGASGAELSLKGGTTQYGYVYVDSGGFRIINPQSGASSGTMQFSTSNTERMRIDSSGNVMTGLTSALGNFSINVTAGAPATSGSMSRGLTVTNTSGGRALNFGVNESGGYLYIQSAYVNSADNSQPLAFFTGPTERARIDSSGNLLVGGTSAVVTAKLGIYQTSADAALFINPSNASYNGTVIYTNTTRAASSAFDFIGCYGNAVGQFRVGGNGVIYAQNTSVQSISDQRLKENIRDSSDGLSVISGLRPVRYDWKEGHGNNQKNQLGFIAQEIETVFPEAVSEWQVNKDDETVYKTVGPGALIPVLVKAIQEQQALITALTTRITALETAADSTP